MTTADDAVAVLAAGGMAYVSISAGVPASSIVYPAPAGEYIQVVARRRGQIQPLPALPVLADVMTEAGADVVTKLVPAHWR